jgi:hypothetical protein
MRAALTWTGTPETASLIISPEPISLTCYRAAKGKKYHQNGGLQRSEGGKTHRQRLERILQRRKPLNPSQDRWDRLDHRVPDSSITQINFQAMPKLHLPRD